MPKVTQLNCSGAHHAVVSKKLTPCGCAEAEILQRDCLLESDTKTKIVSDDLKWVKKLKRGKKQNG